jgi:phosphoglycerate dehydrogenase-like enzyme
MKVLITVKVEENKKKLFDIDGVEVIYKNKNDVTADDLKDVEAVLGDTSYDLVNTSSTVKWYQRSSAGIGDASKLKDGILLTNASGAYGEAISEHMIGCTLAVMKNLYRYYDDQKDHSWINLGTVRTISQCRVLSVGMGNIGSAYARRMHALGAKVDGVRRTLHASPDYVNAPYTMKDLDRILPKYDIVALSLPETQETYHVMNEARLRLMKDDAILLNTGRGSAIDEGALIKVMKEGHLAGACLDVSEHEPLPKNDPLWETPRVYITPHISGKFNTEATYDHVLQIFHDNLMHYVKHEPLEHVVDISRGY